jgi:tetratricopeptide (TPR) repeat protein
MPRVKRFPRRNRSSLLRLIAVGLVATSVVPATAALAQSTDLAAGVQALERGDDVEAVRLISRALDSGGLTPAEQESAYVQRARASLATGDAADALDDARKALAVNPNDDAAAGVRQRAQVALDSHRPQGQQDPSQAAAAVALNSRASAKSAEIAAENAATTKAYKAAEASYHQNLTQYQADRQAEQDRYAAAQAAYQAKLKADEEKQQADLAAWKARAAACKRGDRSRCAAK